MYPYNYIIPNNSSTMYRNTNNLAANDYSYDVYNSNDDRFLLAPFVFGGLAGTALGFGIANNNQLNNRPCCGWQMMPMPYFPQYYTNYNNTNSFFY